MAPVSARETSGVTTTLIVRYVRTRGGDAAVARVLDHAGESRTARQLEDEATWSTYEQKVRLLEAASDELGDPRIAIHVGETILDQRVGLGLKLLLRALGSPQSVLKNLAATAPKFTTCATMQTSDLRKGSALVTYRLHDGYPPHVQDCALNVGLLSQVPVLFGLPAARVEHDTCQVQGAPMCRYVVRWRPRSRWWTGAKRRRIALLEDQLRTVSERAGALHSTVADLVSPDELDVVLQRIAARAAGAVGARGHLLVVRPDPTGEPVVYADGLTAAETEQVLAAAQRTDPSLLVAGVVSSRRAHGRLIAVGTPGQHFFAEERQLLESYARHAAIALDVALALREARDREECLAAQSRALQQSEQRYKSLFEHNSDAVFSFDLTGCFTSANPAVEELIGYPVEELLGGHFLPLVDAADAEAAGQVFLDALQGMGQDFELRVLHRSNRVVTISGTSFPMVVDGEIVGVYGIAKDVTEQRRLEGEERARQEELSRLAFSDALTMLPNRAHFLRQLGEAVAHDATLLFIDLDGLKAMNDEYGHAAGDALLVAMAERLRACIRPDDAAARLGGDEFAVLVRGGGYRAAEALAERILVTVSAPVVHGDQLLATTASVGIAVSAGGTTDAETLLARADAAMYRAKRAGKGCYVVVGASSTPAA